MHKLPEEALEHVSSLADRGDHYAAFLMYLKAHSVKLAFQTHLRLSFPIEGGLVLEAALEKSLGGVTFVNVVLNDGGWAALLNFKLDEPIPHDSRQEHATMHLLPDLSLGPIVPISLLIIPATASDLVIAVPLNGSPMPAPGSPDSYVGINYSMSILPATP